uniref:mRNA m(6)A methyltransferase n=1 Tax=Amphiprion percula TaxID=161767 RepID=A0A3P8T6V7_AMPPE
MNVSDIPFLIHRVQYDIGPHFAAVTASTLLGRLSTRFRSVFMGIFDHSSRSAFVRSHTDVGPEGLALSLCSNSSQRCSIGLRSGLCVGQSSSSTPDSPDSLSYNTADSGFAAQVASYHSSTLEFTELLRATHSFTNVCKNFCRGSKQFQFACWNSLTDFGTGCFILRCIRCISSFSRIINKHTDESLGNCSFLNTCFHMDNCKYIHYEIDSPPEAESSLLGPQDADSNVGKLFPSQSICCDIRYLDVSILGKFAVVMADPPWDIHMKLPYGTLTDDEMRKLNIPILQDDGFLFLWVTGRAMELGRRVSSAFGVGFVHVLNEIIWVKTNQHQRIIRSDRTGHWLNHGKEHCWYMKLSVGVKGNPQGFNRGLDCDVIVAEVRSTTPGRLTRFKKRYPGGVIPKPKNMQ